MAAAFGQVGPFEQEQEDWVSYTERLQHFFLTNKIEGKQRLSVFLSTIGAPTYKILRSIVAPDKPGDKDLDALMEALKDYQIMQRFKFNSRNRLPGESIAQYVANLRSLSEHCEFRSFWNDMLRDRLVCGIENPAIQKKLLAECNLTFEKALDIAVSMEAAIRDAKSFDQAPSQVNKLTSRTVKQKIVKDSEVVCYRCNGKGHTANKCLFKDAICHHCKKKGHIRKACRLRNTGRVKLLAEVVDAPKEVTSSDDKAEEYTLFTLKGGASTPFKVDMQVDEQNLVMELDTGASRSVISEATYRRYFQGKQFMKER